MKEKIIANKNLIIIVSLIIILPLLIVVIMKIKKQYSYLEKDIKDNKDMQENITSKQQENIDKIQNNTFSLGSEFKFDGFRIKLDKDYSIVTIQDRYDELYGNSVIKLGATIKNESGKTGSINMFYLKYFGSKGTSGNDAYDYFDDSVEYAGDLRDGASYRKYFYLLYDGNGKYGIDFDNWDDDALTVEFDVAK